MEIRVDVANNEQGDDLKASAYYVFVARDAENPRKSKPVPELVFDGEKDPEGAIIRYETGKKNQTHRKSVAEVRKKIC